MAIAFDRRRYQFSWIAAMHARPLKYFLAVYENHGISAAAERLRISQPALTKSIHKLESELGVPLFERRPGGVVPTRYADMLARRVRLMDIEYRHAVAEIAAARGGSEGAIRIGAGPVWYSCFLPPIIEKFLVDWPETHISVQSGVINTLVPALEAGEFDIVCTSLEFPDRAGIVKEAVIDVRHSIVAAETHPLAGQAIAEPAELASYPWITVANDHVGTGRIWSYFAAHECPPPEIAVEFSSLSGMLELVAGGRFLAHFPEVVLGTARRYGVCALNIRGTLWETPAGLIYRQTEHRLRVVQKFIEAVRAMTSELERQLTRQVSSGPGRRVLPKDDGAARFSAPRCRR
jgi:DNA-binding transcriptional LysR family regulator